MIKRASKPALDIPVSFGGVSIGESTARLSMKILKECLNIVNAEEAFCERRLSGLIQLGGSDDSPGQGAIFDKDLVIDATFDIHRFGVSAEYYTTGATFKLKEIEVGDLAQFSKGTGRLIVNSIEVIPEAPVEPDGDGNDSHQPGMFKADGPWTKFSLDELFSGGVLKSLKAAGLDTVGDLHEYQQPAKNGHINQLTDIKGIGGAKVTLIEDTMIHFWSDNPQE